MTPQPAEAVAEEELKRGDDTPGIVRKVAFETDNNVTVKGHVAGGVESGWHTHCDRHVYGYLVDGTAVLEYGAGGKERLPLDAGEFFHLQPRTVHRDVNPSDEEQVWILNFVGEGPLVENVDGPDPE